MQKAGFELAILLTCNFWPGALTTQPSCHTYDFEGFLKTNNASYFSELNFDEKPRFLLKQNSSNFFQRKIDFARICQSDFFKNQYNF